MQKMMKRTLALLLAVVLCFGTVPISAFATEIDPNETVSSEAQPNEALAESTPEPTDAPAPDASPSPTGSPAPVESEEPGTEPTTEPSESPSPSAEPTADPSSEPTTVPDDPGLTPGTELDVNRVWPAVRRAMARAAGQYGTNGTLYVGDYCFPGGVGTPPTLGEYIGPMPIETMRYGSNNVAAFCIEHEKESGSGMGYTWMDLSTNNQETLGTILALGFQWNAASPWGVPSDNSDKWVVTQVLIWETIAGNTFVQANGLIGVKDGVDADMEMISAHAYNPTKFLQYYRDLKKRLNDYFKVPSFANKEASKAETITLRWDGSKYSATVTDSNGVLDNYKFESCLPGVTVTTSGNKLTLSSANAIMSPKTSSSVKSADGLAGGKGAVAVWRTADRSFQDFAIYYKEGGDPVSCYIKVKTDAVGSAGLVKTSEDGKVSGIQFQITGSDGSSTTKTTDASGNIDIEGLPIYSADGSKITYTATEINVPNKYVKPQSQTFQLTEGQTASIHFENKLKRWRVTVTKVVATLTTDENGYASTADEALPYGSYTMREKSSNSSMLLTFREQTVEVAEDKKVYNVYADNDVVRGGLSVQKLDSKTGEKPQGDANYAGIVFEIINDSENPVSRLSTTARTPLWWAVLLMSPARWSRKSPPTLPGLRRLAPTTCPMAIILCVRSPLTIPCC